jgi:hypothetical protein
MLAVSTHWDVSSDPPRAAMVCGIASGTAVWSTRIMLLANVMATSVAQRTRGPMSAIHVVTPYGCHRYRASLRYAASFPATPPCPPALYA